MNIYNKWLSLHKHYSSSSSHSLLYLGSTNTNSVSLTQSVVTCQKTRPAILIGNLGETCCCSQFFQHPSIFMSPSRRHLVSILYLPFSIACPNETAGEVYFALYQYSVNQHVLTSMGLLNPTCLCAQTALWPQM